MLSEKQKQSMKECLAMKAEFSSKIEKNPDWGFDSSDEEFVLGMMFLNDKSSSLRMQNRIASKLDVYKSRDPNLGDLGNLIEVKGSEVYHQSKKNKRINLRQIRREQPVDYIVYVAYNDRIEYFHLTHDQMLKELELCKATPTHGTEKVNKLNPGTQGGWSITIPLKETDKKYKRWQNYKMSLNEIKTYYLG